MIWDLRRATMIELILIMAAMAFVLFLGPGLMSAWRNPPQEKDDGDER